MTCQKDVFVTDMEWVFRRWEGNGVEEEERGGGVKAEAKQGLRTGGMNRIGIKSTQITH